MAKHSISIEITFASKEEYDLYHAAQVGAGTMGDMSSELKATVKKLYKEQTNRDLPDDGEYYIDPNYSEYHSLLCS